MERIPLPSKITYEASDENRGIVTIEPCYPGYGTTLGNALRRVLLSSLPGAAVTELKIENVQHEFSSLPYVKEDIVDILLNVKQLRVKMHEGEEATLKLTAKGEKKVTAADCEVPSNVEIANPDLVLFTLTDKSAEISVELKVQKGRGYVPVEARIGGTKEIGVIAVDAIYTPVKNVNFDNENVRVGQMTNFDKLTLDIMTDGTLSPQEAFQQATELLVEHFVAFKEANLGDEPTKKPRAKKAKSDDAEPQAESETTTLNEE